MTLNLGRSVIPVEVSASQKYNSRRLENVAEYVERVCLLANFNSSAIFTAAIGKCSELLLLVENFVETRLNPIDCQSC